MAEFVMPSLGADMQEATLLKWRIQPGNQIKRGQVIGEVDTAKGVIDLECFQEGIVEKLVANEGETIPVGAVMLLIKSKDEKALVRTDEVGPTIPRVKTSSEIVIQDTRPSSVSFPLEAKESSTQATREDMGDKGADQELAAKKLLQPEGTPPPTTDIALRKSSTRFKVSPLARRRAEELGIDLAIVSPATPDSAISVADVEQAAKSKPAVSSGKAPEASRQALRTAIAAAMSKSKREIPHYYLQTSIDMSKGLAWLEQENAKRSIDHRLLPAVVMLKAVSRALAEVPQLNGHWQDGKLQVSDKVHAGFAIAMTGGGLVAPAIHDVDSKNLDQLMADLRELIPRARAGRLRSSELTDATVTITNLGDLGVESVTGIIYPPQVALIGFGKILDRPWVESGALCVRPVLVASLSADHRATDGLSGAKFLENLGRILQEPQLL